jgi:predicted RNA-binding protein with PUA-like domain
MKSEPDTYGIDHLIAKGGPDIWEGCRNYTVRNFFRDDFEPGDMAFFYHSVADPTGIAGTMRITRGGYPDPTQFDPDSKYYDPKSDPESPRWLAPDVEFVEKFGRIITLAELKTTPGLENMLVVRKGQRLSVMPVEKSEWEIIMRLASVDQK